MNAITGLTVAALVVAVAVLVWAVETRLRALYARPANAAEFRPVVEGTVWRPCHDTACGHMTTRWTPAPDGGLRCEQAARHRGAVHLTHTTTDTTKGD
ncbi:hypothetical protein [Streptomyces sp. NPDC005322]|uniref:hypothetical protein n=1 Tax=Streptomyces sp. NPDC005322 TaxID=3157032 RepID=UPI0033BC794E